MISLKFLGNLRAPAMPGKERSTLTINKRKLSIHLPQAKRLQRLSLKKRKEHADLLAKELERGSRLDFK